MRDTRKDGLFAPADTPLGDPLITAYQFRLASLFSMFTSLPLVRPPAPLDCMHSLSTDRDFAIASSIYDTCRNYGSVASASDSSKYQQAHTFMVRKEITIQASRKAILRTTGK